MSRRRRLAIAVTALVGAYLLVQLVPVAATVAYAGTSPPGLVVESNSMMHVDPNEDDQGDLRADGIPFGRIGTIDSGDMVLVRAVEDPSEIPTFADGGEERYGKPGEVVAYFPGGDRGGTPIVHRAMTYVAVAEPDEGEGPTRYEVRWHEDWDREVGCADESDANCTEPGDCQTNERGRLVCTFQHGFRIPALLAASQTHVYRPSSSGFITQGDNPNNVAPDQVLFGREPVSMDWIHGVARGELPWFGVTELAWEGTPANTAGVDDHPYVWSIGGLNAPRDLWIGGIAITGLWWSAWLGALYVAYRYVRDGHLPGREPPEDVSFGQVPDGDPGQRS